MDVWETNSISQAFTTHTCKSVKSAVCTGDQSGGTSANQYNGICNKDGCDFASYRWGATEFYGQGKKVDTSKPFTNKLVKFNGLGKANSLLDKFCAANKKMTGDKNDFEKKGGTKKMGEAKSQGMVLFMSIWPDNGEAKLADKYGVKWGTCDANTGVPEATQEQFGNDQVIFLNLKIWPIQTASEAKPETKQKKTTFHI
ncbi:hypothetical protein PTTG_28074 [Puccinia triticina 1-1 BBBD Race 1]|uniref:cellulose 1,4-beta-cellobiosidase (non-reducing end) n=1 Tax=Puccinia triticina (isolate 1-1 / race 1 (BBBD)) TaxID=630390 RepID=A0A180GET5_PUCT1|nr:hypothetical protein PTTG_28074 [Puccinia triticina 1-1 BBBD Race 1]